MDAENLDPLEELQTLGRRVDQAGSLADLKPIFFRLDEIAKENPRDFEVQLTVGDLKQQVVTRGNRIKEMQKAAQAMPPVPPAAAPPAASPLAGPPLAGPPPAGPPQLPADLKPPGLTSSAQFNKPPVPAAAPLPPPSAPVPPSSLAPVIPRTVSPPTPPRVPGAPMPATPPQPPSQPPVNWKRAVLLGALGGSVLSILLIVFLVNQARKHNFNLGGFSGATVALEITTTPPGAAVRISSAANTAETKCTSNCKVPLPPGNYQVTAFLDGYQPSAGGVTIAAGQPASIALALDPQPQSVRILSDLDQGKVTFDDQPPADLQEGQFILDKVAPGPHSIKIAGRSSEASFTFELTAGKPPVVTGPVTVRNLVAMLVSSFGSQAHIVTNSGPMKLAVNGQPQGDASPAGVDVNNFQPGVDELVLGDGKDQRNMKENFGPAPMLTAFLKSDLNIGTLIVSTGEDDVRVFLNDKEFRRKTQRGQARIPAIGKVTVRVAKDGFENDPPQVAEVKKGSEVRLEFKMQALPQMSILLIRGATPGAEVLIDQKSAGTTGDDGAFSYSTVTPGDHTIEFRRDQFQPKRLQRSFRAGQVVMLSGADVVLGSTNATIKLARTPADAAVFYRRADETQNHEVRGNQLDLGPGSYILTARAPGYAEHTQRVQLAAGETRSIEIALTREKAAPAAAPAGGMADFVDPNAWKQQNGLWVHTGAGFVPYKLKPNGVFTFTVELLKGGNIFRGGRIRWAMQYADAKNYDLFELDKKNFWSKVIVKGKALERPKAEHPEDKDKTFTVQIEATPEHLVHKLLSDGKWITLDTWAEPGRDFTDGKFGFVIQGNDEIGISDFKFAPK